MDEAERQARAYWTQQGVDRAVQDRILADLIAKAQPGAWVGPFQIFHTIARLPDRERTTS